jgi:hypothetical protein
MELNRFVDRREFTLEAVLAALSGVVITIGCGGGGGTGGGYSSPTSSTTTPTSSASSGDVPGSISNNHGHVAIITGGQLLAGNAVQLDIRGQADHTHTVVLSADSVASIKAGGTLSVDSTITDAATYGSHVHTVTFNGTANPPSSPY